MAKKGAAEKKPADSKKGGKGASKASDDTEDKGKVSASSTVRCVDELHC